MPQEMFRESLWTDCHWRIETSPKNWTMKSRYLIEKEINRKLTSREKVYYKDKNTFNCVLDNLYVMDFARRIKFWILPNQTMVVQSMKAWSKNADKCSVCKSDETPHHALNMCKTCYYLDYKKPKYRKISNV